VSIRLSALIIVLSISSAAAGPLLCELSCVTPSHTAAACHDESTGVRLSADESACDHSAYHAAVVTAVSKVSRPPMMTPLAALASFQVAPPQHIRTHSHGPPGAIRSITATSSPILRI